MKIKAVIFDLDDTLLWDARSVEEAFSIVCAKASEETGVDPAELKEAVKREARALYASYETYSFTRNIGINPFEGLWGNFLDPEPVEFTKMRELMPSYRKDAWTRGLQAVGIDNPALGEKLGELFHEQRRKLPYVYEDTYPILDALKGKVKLFLLTNGSPDLQQEKLKGVPKLAPYFDHILVSGSFGHGKPSRLLFEHVLQTLEVQPTEAIMVGDKLTTDIQGANGVGIPSVWINRHQTQRNDEIVPSFEIQGLMEVLDVINQLQTN